jgi:hypothetical protein
MLTRRGAVWQWDAFLNGLLVLWTRTYSDGEHGGATHWMKTCYAWQPGEDRLRAG